MNSSCPICLDLFDGCDIVATQCGHVFHSKCILKWVDNTKFCPECRTKATRNNIMKLYFNTSHSETMPLTPGLQNDLDSKKAELRAKDAEIASAAKKIKDLQEHAANTEQLYHQMYQKYLAAQSEMETAKLHLKKVDKLESKIVNLVKQNSILENQLTQFNQLQTILQGTQQEAEEVLREQGVLLAQEVGVHVAKNMANLCSILKRELFKVKAQKEQSKKQEEHLLFEIGVKNAKVKKLQADLQRQLKYATASPRPVMCVTNGAGSSSSEHVTPVSSTSNSGKIRSVASTDRENSELTPILIDFSEKKRPAMKKVVIESGTTHPAASFRPSMAKPIMPAFKRSLDTDKDSVMRIGYNGLGGHERVIISRSQEFSNPKPYKKNPNSKKVK